ncbi:GNAT family N-acetyltransferase [Francisella orientalis]|uniref:Acetyltransferase, GNAT family n=1 Tax=Francisella orientalis TaxID=299583 RepID=A0AAP6X6L3_9GAMM|nr:GNAT family N-acetyltransferase [Francisella orientalis]AFJ43298.1 Acetyltransferase (GNAT) family [Francisella orientalis str. Toba 04]AHB99285.1 hypothetical protein M973_08215 [Francisella orientalis LADL 07-285A]AKN86035.1 acetyltransferase, GNAT family [Francisella orientalis FNO12]AKN87573.1 acetyltransferase, GNAT family [Francisella orientalis FNO24]AKN89111.1 acetyltransferase, GNAT family [Francisella orientalis]
MKLLEKFEYIKIYSEFDDFIIYFPIILSVVDNKQEGYVFQEGSTFIIVHKFGFCYILGEYYDYAKLIDRISEKLKVLVPKLRLYDPNGKLKDSRYLLHDRCTRIKYIHSLNMHNDFESQIEFFDIQDKDDSVYDFFDLELDSRYWSTCLEFRENSFAIVDEYNIGICYAAAISHGYAETDVFVNKKVRGKGLATGLVKSFVNKCISNNVIPVWDCYSNNQASINLANKTGFKRVFEYYFYNINI